MVFPPAALIEIGGEKGGKEEEKEKNLVEKLHASIELQRTELNDAVGREGEEEEEGKNTPLRYVPLCDVYSATSPCVSSASGGSKKVKPPHHHHRKSLGHFGGHDRCPPKPHQLSSSTAMVNSHSSGNGNSGRIKPPISHFYTRRDKVKRKHEGDGKGESEPLHSDMWQNLLLADVNLVDSKPKEVFEEENGELIPKRRKKRKSGGHELVNLGVDTGALIDRDRSRLREVHNTNVIVTDVRSKTSNVEISNCGNNGGEMRSQNNKADTRNEVKHSGSLRKKKWVWCDSRSISLICLSFYLSYDFYYCCWKCRLSFSGVDPMKFVGLQCKVRTLDHNKNCYYFPIQKGQTR